MVDLVRMLAGAVRPGLAPELARLRRSETELAGRSPRPMVLVVLGVDARVGTSTLVALLATTLAAMAPDRVAVVDGDTTQPAQRIRLGTDGTGDLRRMISSPQPWRSRRVVEQYLAQGSVPLLAPAAGGPGAPVPPDQLGVAVTRLRHRYPIIVVDLPLTAESHYGWTARTADRVLLVGRPAGPLRAARNWFATSHSDRLLVVAAMPSGADIDRTDVDVFFPEDAALRADGPARLAQLRWPTLAAIEEIVGRILPA